VAKPPTSGDPGSGRRERRSGKTWLALRLADALHLPVIHLDLYRYDSYGTSRSDEMFRSEVRERLTESPEWVADGNYLSTLEERLALADVVVFLDLRDLVCLVGVRTRRQVRALANQVALLGRMPTSALGERDGR